MDLGELIDTHRGGRSYVELSRDCGGSPTDKRLQQLVRQPIKNFPDPGTVMALARGLRVNQSVVVLAAAESLGLDVRTAAPRLVELLPASTATLSEVQAAAIAHLVRAFAEAPVAAEADYDDEHDGPAPKVADVLAARAAAAAKEPTVAGVLEAKRRRREEMQRPRTKAARDPKPEDLQ